MKFMEELTRLMKFAAGFPGRFENLEKSFQHLIEQIIRYGSQRETEKTTILVLPPDNNEVLTRRVSLFDHDLSMSFAPQRSLPKGCWIVLLGPGTVKSVTVGNQYQSSGYSADGPLWKTIDDCEIGVYLTVVVGR